MNSWKKRTPFLRHQTGIWRSIVKRNCSALDGAGLNAIRRIGLDRGNFGLLGHTLIPRPIDTYLYTNTMSKCIHILASSKWPFDSPNGGHLSPKKVTYGPKRGHFEEPTNICEYPNSMSSPCFENKWAKKKMLLGFRKKIQPCWVGISATGNLWYIQTKRWKHKVFFIAAPTKVLVMLLSASVHVQSLLPLQCR